MEEINYEDVISQLKSELNTQAAIANNYGIVLASGIDEFAEGKIIPQKILEVINAREKVAEELNLETINSFALEAEENNYLFTFSKNLILISKLDLEVNLAKFMPSVRAFVKNLSKKSKKDEIKEFTYFDFKKEISKIEKGFQKESMDEKKYSIIKDLIKYISE
ncbi:MAG: hypothetical protein BAJALOKI2v1_1080009 [Promethearchaeota archaeon]|nr:MAG: hypothetical protein BAJALOKI2v1_1080009 [Candidatus Lokiarchaeota archaeon]